MASRLMTVDIAHTKHEIKQCPRCGVDFECKLGSILECQCAGVALTSTELTYIQLHFEDCLCAPCLQALKAEYAQQPHTGAN